MTALKPSSWAERVRVSDSNSRCTLEKISRQPPGTILQIPHDMQLAEAEDWKRSMIGSFQPNMESSWFGKNNGVIKWFHGLSVLFCNSNGGGVSPWPLDVWGKNHTPPTMATRLQV
uniref:Uncharacterized protein n=1 Tax=Salix viminalis TaxID=40686 RepID=A0A6N2KT37_SALVM